MKRLVWDIEADNLLDNITTIHCAVTVDLDTDEIREYTSDPKDGLLPISQLLWDLMKADQIWGHNIISYDIPAIAKVLVEESFQFLDQFKGMEGFSVLDSMVCSRTIWPDITSMDYENLAKGTLVLPNEPSAKKKLIGSHSLRAWGYRLGYFKGNSEGEVSFEKYTPEMLEYCKRDVLLNVRLIRAMEKKEPGLAEGKVPYHIQLEHQFYRYLEFQQQAGVEFDVEFAEYLCHYWEKELKKRVAEMRTMVPDILTETTIVPKVNNQKLGYEKGVPFVKRKVTQFNPKSGDHVRNFLISKYNWKPAVFTKPSKKHAKGQPEVSYEVLSHLKYKEAPLLARIRLLIDRLNLVKNGKSAWLNAVKRTEFGNRIYGRIIHNGTPTARCRHMAPNLGNIPSEKAIWGTTLRKLFKTCGGNTVLFLLAAEFSRRAPKGALNPFQPFIKKEKALTEEYKLLGIDFDGLEMRCLAEVLYDYDGGAFYEMAFNGRKEDGTDAHSLNLKAIKEILAQNGYVKVAEALTRYGVKTVFYAWLYGAGSKKLGDTAAAGLGLNPKLYYNIGECIKAGFKKNIKGLGDLVADLESEYDRCLASGKWPHLQLIDGRRVPIRKKSALLNSLLQAMGAILCKWACVRFMSRVINETLYGDPLAGIWRPVLHVHDEIQSEVRNEEGGIVTELEHLVTECFRESGEYFGFRIPIVGTASVGNNWSETH